MSIAFISRLAAVLFVLGAFCFSFQGDAKPKKKKEGKKVESKSKDCDADKLKDMLIFDIVSDYKLRNALVEKRDKKLLNLLKLKECAERVEGDCVTDNVIFSVAIGRFRFKECAEAVVVFGQEDGINQYIDWFAIVGLKGGKLVVNYKSEFYGEATVEAMDVDQNGTDEMIIYHYEGPGYCAEGCECGDPDETYCHIFRWEDSGFVELLEYQTDYDNTYEKLRCSDDDVIENPPYKVVKSRPIKYLSSGPGIFNGILLHVEDCLYGDQDHKKVLGCVKSCQQISIDHKKKKSFIKKLDAGCTKEIAVSIPFDVPGLSSSVSAIAAGCAHTCAIMATGGVKCWGYNNYGQLGDATTTNRASPIDVTGLSSGVSAIDAGFNTTCALMTTGGVKCWGYNKEVQLGDGFTTDMTTPVDVTGPSFGVSAIASGSYHTSALLTTGCAKCWGLNGSGQLGDGSLTNRNTPVDVWDLSSGVSAIAAGSSDTCALLETGSVKCWGNTKGIVTKKKDFSSIIHLEKEDVFYPDKDGKVKVTYIDDLHHLKSSKKKNKLNK